MDCREFIAVAGTLAAAASASPAFAQMGEEPDRAAYEGIDQADCLWPSQQSHLRKAIICHVIRISL
jgi:hypothetical protein